MAEVSGSLREDTELLADMRDVAITGTRLGSRSGNLEPWAGMTDADITMMRPPAPKGDESMSDMGDAARRVTKPSRPDEQLPGGIDNNDIRMTEHTDLGEEQPSVELDDGPKRSEEWLDRSEAELLELMGNTEELDDPKGPEEWLKWSEQELSEVMGNTGLGGPSI